MFLPGLLFGYITDLLSAYGEWLRLGCPAPACWPDFQIRGRVVNAPAAGAICVICVIRGEIFQLALTSVMRMMTRLPAVTSKCEAAEHLSENALQLPLILTHYWGPSTPSSLLRRSDSTQDDRIKNSYQLPVPVQ